MYGKIFKQIYKGTLAMVGPWEALVTFQQMIILADQDGVVDMTTDALSRETTIPLEIITKGVEALSAPDPESRTPDEEGRRIVLLSENRSWGWRIVNYDHYRKLKSEEERREYHRQYYREKRSKSAIKEKLNRTQTPSTVSRQVEVEVEVEGINKEAWGLYVEHRKEIKAKRLTPRSTKMAMNKLAKLSPEDQMSVVETSVANGWTGLFPEKVKNETHHKRSFDAKLAGLRERAGLDAA